MLGPVQPLRHLDIGPQDADTILKIKTLRVVLQNQPKLESPFIRGLQVVELGGQEAALAH